MDTNGRNGCGAAALALALAIVDIAYLLFNDGCPADGMFIFWLPLLLLNPVIFLGTAGSLSIAFFAGHKFGRNAYVGISFLALAVLAAIAIYAHIPHAVQCGPYP